MSKPFDATAKDLLESDPAAWVAFLGRPVATECVSLVDADVSVVTAEADKVIRVADPEPWILHLEFQTSHDATLPERMLRYHALLRYRHRCPVASAAILLRPQSDASNLTGHLKGTAPIGPNWSFAYDVVRMWERPVESYMAGPLALLPFAPLSAKPEEVADVVRRLRDRYREVDRAETAKLLMETYLLMGLRFEQNLIQSIVEGAETMEDSVTYQAIIQKGVKQGRLLGTTDTMREMVLRAGNNRFHQHPPLEISNRLQSIDDYGRLTQLFDRAFKVSSWDELLDGLN